MHKGVDLDAQSGRYGGTAIVAALWRRHPHALHTLLLASANPNIPDLDRYPLHEAARDGHPTIIRILLEYGAAWNVEDSDGLTPMDWARQSGQDMLTKIFLETGQLHGNLEATTGAHMQHLQQAAAFQLASSTPTLRTSSSSYLAAKQEPRHSSKPEELEELNSKRLYWAIAMGPRDLPNS